MVIVIANIIALVASIIMVYTGVFKNKKLILNMQNVQMGLLCLSNALLGGISGAIMNGLGIVRNLLCYYKKFNIPVKILFIIISTILTILFNNMGIIGYFPLIAVVVYTWLITIEDIVKFKILIIFTMVMWVIWDFTIKSYTTVIFDLFTIVTNLISIYSIKHKKV